MLLSFSMIGQVDSCEIVPYHSDLDSQSHLYLPFFFAPCSGGKFPPRAAAYSPGQHAARLPDLRATSATPPSTGDTPEDPPPKLPRLQAALAATAAAPQCRAGRPRMDAFGRK